MEQEQNGTYQLTTLDVQKRQEDYPQSVAWVWTQVESVVLPGNQRLTLKTTIYTAEIRSKSYATCAIWQNQQWTDVWRLEAGAMWSVSAFSSCDVRASQGTEVFDQPDILQAVQVDAIAVRTVTINILCHPS